MIDKCVQKDLGYYSVEITKDKEGKPSVIVKFKFTDKPSWVYAHSWCPTLAELEFLYNTKKMMEQTKNIMGQSK
jgi:hypothetical protein